MVERERKATAGDEVRPDAGKPVTGDIGRLPGGKINAHEELILDNDEERDLDAAWSKRDQRRSQL